MFGQHQPLGRGQLCAHKSYRLVDTWGRSADGSAMTKGAKDAAVLDDLPGGFQARVFQAAKNSANGKSTPEDSALKDEIAAMLELAKIGPSVAAALLRTCNTAPGQETGFQVLNPSLSTRTDGGSDDPRSYYDPKRPSPGKRAGDREFMDLLKGYMDLHGIGRRGSPARATAPALDLLRGLEAGRRNRHRQKGLAG